MHARKEVIQYQPKGTLAIIDQILKVKLLDFGAVQPGGVWGKAGRYVGELDFQAGTTEDTGLQSRLKIRQRGKVFVVNMLRGDVRHIEDVGDNYIPWVPEDEVGTKSEPITRFTDSGRANRCADATSRGRSESSHARDCARLRLRPLSPSYSA